MAKDYRKEIGFRAGEISPLLYGASDNEFYEQGLAIAENVYIDKRGGAIRRAGLSHVGQISGNDSRVFTKQITKSRFDKIVLRDSEMLVIGPGAGFLSPNLLSNGTFVGGSANWTVTVSAGGSAVSFADNVCTLEPKQTGAGRLAAISQQATVTAGIGDNHIVRIRQTPLVPLNIKIGTTDGANDIAEFDSAERLIEGVFVPNNATYWVRVTSSGFDSPGSELTFVGSIAEADVGGLGLDMVAPWTEDQLHDVHMIESPDGETLYFTHPKVAQQKLVYDFATDVYSTLVAVTFTSPPAEWTGTNFPATGCFFQGRMWYGGSFNEPQTFWGSKSALPDDFTQGSLAADAMTFTLQKFGRIEWMIGTKNLLIGTDNGEHLVSSQDGVITPADHQITQQSAYGSKEIQSLQVGEKVVYITPDGRKLRAMSFDESENNWLSQDLTFASEHITSGKIIHRAWAQNPNSLLILVMEDGVVLTFTYDRTSQTAAWTRYLFDGMVIHDAAVGLIDGNSRLIATGQRTDGFIDIDIATDEDVYLDSYVVQFHDPVSNTVDNLDHLEGEVVQVVVDGAVTEPQTVSGGSITAAISGSLLFAGKQISSKIVTLPPDVANEQIRSWKKRWNKVWVLVSASLPPIINGKRPPDRSPSTPMDTPEPAASGHHKVVNLGWDDFGQITIEENLPVPMKVIGIYGEMVRETL